jgi:pyridinium-3,5-biscarboxylic acid mononucleotide synthase
MQEDQIRLLLEGVSQGAVEIDDALTRLRALPYETVGNFAHLDQHRALRCGFPEVVFGQGKTPDQVVQIVRRLSERNDKVMVTRVTPEMNASFRRRSRKWYIIRLPVFWFWILRSQRRKNLACLS